MPRKPRRPRKPSDAERIAALERALAESQRKNAELHQQVADQDRRIADLEKPLAKIHVVTEATVLRPSAVLARAFTTRPTKSGEGKFPRNREDISRLVQVQVMNYLRDHGIPRDKANNANLLAIAIAGVRLFIPEPVKVWHPETLKHLIIRPAIRVYKAELQQLQNPSITEI